MFVQKAEILENAVTRRTIKRTEKIKKGEIFFE